MKKLLSTLSLATVTAFCALSVNAHAQSVSGNGLGSSGLFLEAGLGASSPTAGSIHATCVWSGNNSAAAGNVVTATDTSVVIDGVTQTLQDSGNAWVAWTPGTGGSCAAPASDSIIYADLSTDSVVGNRCLFNAVAGKCSIAYPTGTPAPAGLILGLSNEVSLPVVIADALNSSTVSFAATDIRPEDAWFAVKRALTACGTAVATGSQYLGLGYNNGDPISSNFSGAPFHAIDFTLPAVPRGYAVTPVGATPIVVAINGTSAGFGGGTFTSITSRTLAQFLDGHLSLTNAVNGTTGGAVVTTLVREPLSGTYNTMEYNVPNRTTADSSGFPFKTSQDVGVNQTVALQACNSTTHAPINPLDIASTGGGTRQRAIGTGQELSEVVAASTSSTQFNALGYSFWSAANFAPFGAVSSTAKYLEVDGIDPLLPSTVTHTGTIPTSVSELANVTLAHVADGTYPIWSLLRFVTAGSATAPTAITNLASATQDFVVFGGTAPRPDFITAPNLKIVRSHFVPPLPAAAVNTPPTVNGQPNPAANGNVGDPTSLCTNPEQGGDVGGVVIALSADSTTCSRQATGMKTGTTGERR